MIIIEVSFSLICLCILYCFIFTIVHASTVLEGVTSSYKLLVATNVTNSMTALCLEIFNLAVNKHIVAANMSRILILLSISCKERMNLINMYAITWCLKAGSGITMKIVYKKSTGVTWFCRQLSIVVDIQSSFVYSLLKTFFLEHLENYTHNL